MTRSRVIQIGAAHNLPPADIQKWADMIPWKPSGPIDIGIPNRPFVPLGPSGGGTVLDLTPTVTEKRSEPPQMYPDPSVPGLWWYQDEKGNWHTKPERAPSMLEQLLEYEAARGQAEKTATPLRTPPQKVLNMKKAAEIKADFKAKKISPEEAKKRLAPLGLSEQDLMKLEL